MEPGTQWAALQDRALRVREHVITMGVGGGAFLGAALSCVDLIVYLYSHFLQGIPIAERDGSPVGEPADPGRDYFFLSKGHAVPALYGTFVELGWLERERLAHHLSVQDDIYWHPNRAIPGVEFHSGSLGHLLAVATGVAIDCKLRGQPDSRPGPPSPSSAPARVVVLTGDGELNEGSNWEALLLANACHLDNLVVVVDRNRLQANQRTEELIPLEPLALKFESFGCQVVIIDGHRFEAIHGAFAHLPLIIGKPSVIIADTVRGKGLPSIQDRPERWFVQLSVEEAESLIRELHDTLP
jgi:transketolase